MASAAAARPTMRPGIAVRRSTQDMIVAMDTQRTR